MLLPHLALAPYVRGMDPLLGLDELSPDQPALVVRRYVAVLATAFGSSTAFASTTEPQPIATHEGEHAHGPHT